MKTFRHVIFFLFTSLTLTSIVAQTTISGTVTDETNEPLPGVNVMVTGTAQGTSTNVEGAYTIEVPDGASQLTFSFLGYGEKIVDIQNADQLNISLSPSASDLDVVVLVGSRNPNRSRLETAVPVDVVDVTQLRMQAPQVSINDMINYLVPSFNSNRQSASDGTEHIDPASLRGLGPDQVLVLVNGKRRHTTSLVNYQNTVGNGSVGTDLSAIPASAVQRIEVLRDGAAAQYGSDAIAGVINIVLKENSGLEAHATVGQTSRGDGETVNINANYGLALGTDGGFLNLSAELSRRGSTNRSGHHDLIIYDQSEFGNFFAYPFTEDPDMARGIDDERIAAAGLTRSDFNFQVGDAEINNLQFFANLAYPLNETFEVYAFGGYSDREGNGFGFRRLPSETSNVVLELYPNGFQPTLVSDISDLSASGGIRASLDNGWLLDLSNTTGRNAFGYTVDNTNNASLGIESPTSFDAGSHSFLQNTTNLDAHRTFDVLSGLSTAFGAEYRFEQYQIEAGEEGSYIDGGAQSFPGFGPHNEVDEDRNNFSFYADAELDVSEQFLVSAAARFEEYSDFGNTINGKLAARWAPCRAFALRGAASTGFRAPSLHQQYFNNSSINISADGSQLATEGIYNQNSPISDAFEIPELQEETSVNLSLGFTLEPIDGLSFTVDAYRIDIDDRIVITSAISGRSPFDGSILNQGIVDLLASENVNSARFFTNAINTETQGIDLVATFTKNLDGGNFRADLAANYTKTEISDYNFPATLAGIDRELFFGPDQESLIETNIPEFKGTLSLSYGKDKWNFLLRTTYFGEVIRNGWPFGGEQVHDPKLVTDVSASYAITDQLTFTAGANNIFDVYPDDQIYDNSYFGVFRFAPVQMGTTGAYYFGRLSFRMP